MLCWINNRLGAMAEGDIALPGSVVLNVMNLRDGSNHPASVGKVLTLGLEILRNPIQPKLILQCKGGISRSPTLAAAILAMDKGVDIDICLSEVAHKLPHARYNYDLIDSIKDAMSEMPQYRDLAGIYPAQLL